MPKLPPYRKTRQNYDIIQGDCRQASQFLEDGCADLVIGDPPFNIGHAYYGFNDNVPAEEYAEFTIRWVEAAMLLLRPGGTACIHVPDSVCKMIIVMEDGLCDRHWLWPADWIIWHYRFAQAGAADKASRCYNSREHLLVYSKQGGERTWNPPMVPSDRATKYKDKRTATSKTPGMRVALNVWGPEEGENWGRVQGNSRERWDKDHGALADHPNQLPEMYVGRIIRTYSNPGDNVVVMFGGSGTETVVASHLGRNVTTFEYSRINAMSIAKRCERGVIREV